MNMNYLALDFGGSSVKWAVMNDDYEILKQGTQADGLSNKDELLATVATLYERAGRPAGGIAVSYCSELDEQTGLLYNSGSYPFMRGVSLAEVLSELCGCRVSVENDANCAALAEVACGSLVGVRDAAVLVVGSGLGGALVLDGKLRRGPHKFAGFFSLLVDDITADLAGTTDFTQVPLVMRDTSAAFLSGAYAAMCPDKSRGELPQNGKEFFALVDAGDEVAQAVLQRYCRILAQVIFNLHLVVDVEAIAVGGGISAAAALEPALCSEFDRIFDTQLARFVALPKPELHIARFHNDANLIGALVHHLT